MRLNQRFSTIEHKFDGINDKLNAIEGVVDTIATDLGLFTLACLENQGLLQTTVVGGITATLTALGGVEDTILSKGIVNTKQYNSHIDNEGKKLKSYTEEKIEKEHEYWNNQIEGLPKIIASETSLAVIVEPYYRYDAISCYHPTLVFIFYEVNSVNKPKRAQIKLRLKETTEELSSARIAELKTIVEKTSNLTFMAGNTRANYVSEEKRMKTSIYCQDIDNAKFILNKVLTILSDKFNENLLSITTNGTNRPNLSKRKTGLAGIGLNTENYNKSFKVKLHHAHLIVNGRKHIIPIWEDI